MLTANDIQSAYKAAHEAGPEAVAALIDDLQARIQRQDQHIASLESALQIIASQQDKLGRYEQQFATLSAMLQGQLANAPAISVPTPAALPAAPPTPHSPPPIPLALTRVLTLEWVLFGLAILVYAVTRFVQITGFPLYFFADEAIEVTLARELIARGFQDVKGNLLPMFFDAYGFQVPLVSVYFHALTSSLFGISPEVTRWTSAFVTLTAAIAAGLIGKLALKLRYWWAITLFLAVMPVWFLHSRTAFETATMVSLYTWFLLFYLLYRTRSPKFIFPALLFAALTFYSYGNGQIVIGVTGLLLLLSDLPYHLKHWRTNALAVAFLVLLAVPYLRWRQDYPDVITNQLRRVDSYLMRPIPLQEKLVMFAQRYWQDGISPDYWFNPNVPENARHILKGYAHLPVIGLPLLLLGLGLCLWRFRSAAHRAIVVALLAAPVGAAVSGAAVTRSLMMVFPAAILMTLGVELLVGWLGRLFASDAPPLPSDGRGGASDARGEGWLPHFASIALASILSIASLAMLRDALTNGPLWFRDYGLYGVQWGAQRIFGELAERLKQNTTDVYLLSPSWANGSDIFLRFFMPNETRVRVETVHPYVNYLQPHLSNNAVFVMTPEEINLARTSGKFKPFEPESKILYPDGSDGFYFVRLAYADNVQALFAADLAERMRPITETVMMKEEPWTIGHSRLDMGTMINIFDRQKETLIRGQEANPFLIDITFPVPRSIKGLEMSFGAMDMELTANIFAEGSEIPTQYTNLQKGLPPDPTVIWMFGTSMSNVKRIQLLVRDVNQRDRANIHVREVKVLE
jgi:hypothetical protein